MVLECYGLPMNINRFGYNANILLLGFKLVGKRRDPIQLGENISLPAHLGLEPSNSPIELSPCFTLELRGTKVTER